MMKLWGPSHFAVLLPLENSAFYVSSKLSPQDFLMSGLKVTAISVTLRINNAEKPAASVTYHTVKLILIVTVIPTFKAIGA